MFFSAIENISSTSLSEDQVQQKRETEKMGKEAKKDSYKSKRGEREVILWFSWGPAVKKKNGCAQPRELMSPWPQKEDITWASLM